MKKVDKSKTTTLRQKADELIIANKELAYQNEEKEKRAAELEKPDYLTTFGRSKLTTSKLLIF